VLNNIGFTVEIKDTTFPMYIFPLIGLNFINEPNLGKKCHNIRMSLEMKRMKIGLNKLLVFIYKFLAKLGLGRTVIVYAKKGQ
jgi:hypothetical protein